MYASFSCLHIYIMCGVPKMLHYSFSLSLVVVEHIYYR